MAQKFAKNGHRAKSATQTVAVNEAAKVVANAVSAASGVTVTRIAVKTMPKSATRRPLSRAPAPMRAWIRAWREKAAQPASLPANAANADRVTDMAVIAANARATPLAKTTTAKKARTTQATRQKPRRSACPM